MRCETGSLPDCEDDIAVVRLARLPADAGLHLLQVQNPHGLFSNDFVFHVVDEPPRAESGNLIGSGGSFDGRGAWRVGLTNASVTWTGEADFTIDEPSPQRWRVQLWHPVAIRKDVEYSLCYSARTDDIRYIETNVDTGAGDYRSLVGTGFDPEVGAATRSTGASLTRRYHRFRHRFISPEDDSSARVFASPSTWRRARSTCRSTTWGCTRGGDAARREQSVSGRHGFPVACANRRPYP